MQNIGDCRHLPTLLTLSDSNTQVSMIPLIITA
jgi:hypothetical protein